MLVFKISCIVKERLGWNELQSNGFNAYFCDAMLRENIKVLSLIKNKNLALERSNSENMKHVVGLRRNRTAPTHTYWLNVSLSN